MLIFILKKTSLLQNKEVYSNTSEENGLTYIGSDTTVSDLVNKDTDGDGISDWQENLYGLDPTKKETTPGTNDAVAFAKIKSEQEGNIAKNSDGTEKLSQTDQFSRELFGTVTSLSQSGTMDGAAVDQLGETLAQKIQNPTIRKVFLISDLKVTKDNSLKAFIAYNDTLNSTYTKYKPSYTVLDVLQKFIVDENNVDLKVLVKLDPIIEKTTKIIAAMRAMSVPESISVLHLNMLNSLERIVENVSDIRLYDSDPIVAMSGISKYDDNATALDTDVSNLVNALNQKLKN